jgi:cytochrome c5
MGRTVSKPTRCAIAAATAITLTWLTLGNRARSEDKATAAAPASAPASQPVAGPITYYNDNCNRCHGQVDAAYPDSKSPPTGEKLKQIIQDMAEGPAQAPLDASGLAEQVKLHEAIFSRGPYVWIDPGATGQISGETIPGTRIKGAEVENIRFTLPATAKTVETERNGQKKSLPTKP